MEKTAETNSAVKARESVFESIERLNADYVHLINVHDIEFADLEQVCNETLSAWAELRNKGIVKHIRIINLNLRHFETENGAPGWHPTPEALKRVIRKAIDYSKSKGVSIEQLAMSFSTANPRIATTLFSSTNPENVLKSIRCTNTPLYMELFTEMQMILEPGFRDTWVNS